jgi:hypothetical protein
MTKNPESFLPPPSQPWGRWVVSNILRLTRTLERFQRDVNNNLRQLNISQRQPMRGLIWRQTTVTVPITTAGVYVPIDAAGTVDANVTFNMEASDAPNVTGLKNTTGQERIMVVIATYDGKGGNNNAIGLKLALNGVLIDGSECRSFGGSSGQVAKTMTQWVVKLGAGDEVSMYAANIDATTNLTIERYKMVAHAVR